LKKHFGVGEARVAEIVGEMIGKSDRTAREWKANFISNEGTINKVSKVSMREQDWFGKMKN
jgi:hypothetical protein